MVPRQSLASAHELLNSPTHIDIYIYICECTLLVSDRLPWLTTFCVCENDSLLYVRKLRVTDLFIYVIRCTFICGAMMHSSSTLRHHHMWPLPPPDSHKQPACRRVYYQCVCVCVLCERACTPNRLPPGTHTLRVYMLDLFKYVTWLIQKIISEFLFSELMKLLALPPTCSKQLVCVVFFSRGQWHHFSFCRIMVIPWYSSLNSSVCMHTMHSFMGQWKILHPLSGVA